jgi:oxygen-independent coproporphyrinogen-3 oxidase
MAHKQKFTEPYVEALIKEIEETALMAKDLGFKAETVYFGGGTPTTLSPKNLERLIKKIKP